MLRLKNSRLFLLVTTLALLLVVSEKSVANILSKQNIADTVSRTLPKDTLIHGYISPDSLLLKAGELLDSIKNNVDVQTDRTTKFLTSVQTSLDTVQNAALASTLRHKTDSATRNLARLKQQALNKVDSIRSQFRDEMEKLPRSPATEHALSSLEQHVTNLTSGIPSVGPGKLGDITSKLSTISTAIPQVEQLSSLTPDLTGATSIPEELSGASSIKNSSIDQIAESAISKAPESKELTGTKIPDIATLSDEQAVKRELANKASQAISDHFIGKESELKASMEKISKLKSRYSDVNSLRELANKSRNPLKGKPLRNRLVPGIQLQTGTRNSCILVDFNPYLNYLLTPRIAIGTGWNHRLGYNHDTHGFADDDQVFGPRISGQYHIGKGWFPKIESELMNTRIPAYLQTTEPDERAWVPGVFLGIKKVYKFFGNTKGTTSIMTRLFNYERKSPYQDVVNFRFGFEFPIKKRNHPQRTISERKM